MRAVIRTYRWIEKDFWSNMGGQPAFATVFANDRSGGHSSRANTFSLLLAIDLVSPGKAAPATRP